MNPESEPLPSTVAAPRFTRGALAERVRRFGGCRVPVQTSPRRPGDPAVLIASSEEARRVLGWSPRFEGLETILETAWDWRLRHPEGYAE